MADGLHSYPLTPRTVHVCVDMQRIFSAEGVWATPWMDRVTPVVAELAGRYPERTVFTRFITPNRPDDMPGMWQRYYTRWKEATREHLDPALLELLPPLAKLCPPATVINKTRYSGFAEPEDWRSRLIAALSPTPIGTDQLARSTGLSIRAVQTTLLELELDGRIERHGSGAVSLIA